MHLSAALLAAAVHVCARDLTPPALSDGDLEGKRLLVVFAGLFGVLVGQSHKHHGEDDSCSNTLFYLQLTEMTNMFYTLVLFLFLTYKCESAEQNPHSWLDGRHALQLLGCNFAVASNVAGTHCDWQDRKRSEQWQITAQLLPVHSQLQPLQEITASAARVSALLLPATSPRVRTLCLLAQRKRVLAPLALSAISTLHKSTLTVAAMRFLTSRCYWLLDAGPLNV